MGWGKVGEGTSKGRERKRREEIRFNIYLSYTLSKRTASRACDCVCKRGAGARLRSELELELELEMLQLEYG